MLSTRNRSLIVVSLALGLANWASSDAAAHPTSRMPEGTDAVVECSPCESDLYNGVHNWLLACCWGGADCFMYPDPDPVGNPGSCPGMHRPCTVEE